MFCLQENLDSSDWSNNFREEAREPFVIRDGAVTILIHLLEQSHLLFWSLIRSRKAKSLLGSGGTIDHGSKLCIRYLSISISICCLETLPGEPVDLPVGVGASVTHALAVLHECILVQLVEGGGQGLGLVVVVGESQPFIKGDSSVSIFINGGKLVLTTALPEFQSKLLREGSCSTDHAFKFSLINFAIKILVSRDESSEEDVVKLNVTVIGGVLAGTLHEVDELVL